MDKKKQLKNVSFGGDWSEKILNDYERDIFIQKLKNIYQSCLINEFPEDDLEEVFYYIKNNIEKGDIFAQSFKDKLKIKDPYQRQTELLRTINNIKKWLPN
ncbi:MAG: hypothetical protein P8K09_03395 [Hyphomicrobiales bacterium]|jgi:hypothetical protein|nr:hypothetical protein [Hyphomicrobiales bacterium]